MQGLCLVLRATDGILPLDEAAQCRDNALPKTGRRIGGEAGELFRRIHQDIHRGDDGKEILKLQSPVQKGSSCGFYDEKIYIAVGSEISGTKAAEKEGLLNPPLQFRLQKLDKLVFRVTEQRIAAVFDENTICLQSASLQMRPAVLRN